MADGGLPALPAPPTPPTLQPPPKLPPVPPVQPIATQPIQSTHVPQLHWFHFQPEFAAKPDEDVEADLLRRNDWMDTHIF